MASADDREEDAIPRSLDPLLNVLADHYRRCVLKYLRQVDGQTASLEAVVNHVYAVTSNRMGERPDHDAIRLTLQHLHLPILEDRGIIDYDTRSRTIRYRPNNRLEALYEYIRSFEKT